MRRSAALLLTAMGCGPPLTASQAENPALVVGAVGREDPTVRGARLVPESLDLSTASVDPGGTARGIAHGVRYVLGGRESLVTATERLDNVSSWLQVPARLGGGYLFLVGETVFRSDDWLTHARPLVRLLRGAPTLSPGLDRMYATLSNGSHVAFDPRTGRPLELGPWPSDPRVGPFLALDGWRAFALTDIQGLVATADAGRTWRAIDVPIRADRLIAVRRDVGRDAWVPAGQGGGGGEAVVLLESPGRGSPLAAPHHGRCLALLPSLEVSPLTNCDEIAATDRYAADLPKHAATSSLKAAIEDGWPLGDDTAIVAGAGTLTRISLTDGAVVAFADDAFDRRLTKCHAVSLAHASAPSAFGFVCGERGETGGRTVVAAYDAARGTLIPLRVFSTPRVVQTSGGSWLVAGACSETTGEASGYCIGTPESGQDLGYSWRDLEAPESAAVGVTTDGRVVRLSMAHPLDAAHLLVSDAHTTATVPLRFPDVPLATVHALERGIWLGGLTGRAPGSVGGWVAYGGTVVGVSIDLTGIVHVGPHIIDLGSPFVSGQYGLGWTRSRRGYETVDGGLTWTAFAAPTLLDGSRARACGPIGCVADGWLRVGWGERAPGGAPPPISVPVIHPSAPAPLSLTCELPLQPLPPVSTGRSGSASSTVSRPWFAAPSSLPSETLVQAELRSGLDLGVPLAPLGRVFAWGPTRGDWSATGRWVVRWRSPFGGPSSVASSAITAAPFLDASTAAAELVGRGTPATSALAVSEDGAHALLVARRPGRPLTLTAVDEAGKMWPIAREDGEPWGGVQAALRIGGEWYIATPGDAQQAGIDLYRADARGARRLAHVIHHLAGATGPVRLARGVDSAAIGVVIDGEIIPDRNVRGRWVVPVELESGRVGTSEWLGAVDLSDRGRVTSCGDGAGAGWVVDSSWPSANVVFGFGGDDHPYLQQVHARLRISTDRVCIERLAGEADPDALGRAVGQSRTSRAQEPHSAPLPVMVDASVPVELRCDTAEN